MSVDLITFKVTQAPVERDGVARKKIVRRLC